MWLDSPRRGRHLKKLKETQGRHLVGLISERGRSHAPRSEIGRPGTQEYAYQDDGQIAEYDHSAHVDFAWRYSDENG